MLLYLLIIVILLRFVRKEGLTTYFKYKEISHLFDHDISGETDCIYTQIPPQIEKVYNIDFDSPLDRYNQLNIDSKYNIPYYDDTSFNVKLDINKNVANNVLPFFQTYRYCDMKDMQPTCTYLTCGTNEEKSESRTIPETGQSIYVVSHNKAVAELLKKKRSEIVPKTINDLNTQRSSLSNQYIDYNNKSNNYINSLY